MLTSKTAEPGQVYGEGTERLSQLSDIVSLSQENDLHSFPANHESTVPVSQLGLPDLQENLPSQPLLPTPELPICIQRLDTSGAADKPLSRFAEQETEAKNSLLSFVHSMAQHTTPSEKPDTPKPARRATRRGPMDEMRQLVRILVKVIPHSINNVKSCEEGGGGNRISEDQIKFYLKNTLGDAPQPIWGVPDGWGSYLAELFTWVTGRHVTREQAMKCAKREPGRSWEAIDSELAKLGILPSTWPLPLTQESLGAALVPTTQPSPTSTGHTSSPKRPAEARAYEIAVKRSRPSESSYHSLDETDELSLWTEALERINAALGRAGSNDSLESQIAIAKVKAEIQSKVQVPSIFPQPASLPLFLAQASHVVPGSVPVTNGQLTTAYTLQLQSNPALASLSDPLPLTNCTGEPIGSLELGLNPSQFLLSQPGGSSSAFQNTRAPSPVRNGSQESPSSQVLDSPPPLRLGGQSSQPSQAAAAQCQSPSPSTDEDENTAVFNPGSLASSFRSPVSNLFKPTALKTDPSLLERPSSQSKAKVEMVASPPSLKLPEISSQAPVLGYYSNGHFAPLAGGTTIACAPQQSDVQVGQAHLTQPVTLSQAFENKAKLQQQSSSWVPNLNASL